MRRSLALMAGAAGLLVLTACTSGPAATSSTSSSALSSSASASPAATTGPPASASTTPSSSATSHPATTTAPATSTAASQGPSLPRGGRTILPNFRVVAYYGGPDGPALGVLGQGTPDQAADAITAQAAQYAKYGRPVQPAMELIATVAQGSPGADGTYSAAISDEAIQSYLDAAHAHKMLLILDFQPGRSEFLPQVQHDEKFLKDPSVGVALDPEWKVGPDEEPGGGHIGSASASSINAVGSYLSNLVAANHLPDKLFVVHQFRLAMLPDRQNITQPKGLELVFHADGESNPEEKIAVYHQLAFPDPPYHVGFKVFFKEDSRVMTPDEVMALSPRPDIVTYQ